MTFSTQCGFPPFLLETLPLVTYSNSVSRDIDSYLCPKACGGLFQPPRSSPAADGWDAPAQRPPDSLLPSCFRKLKHPRRSSAAREGHKCVPKGAASPGQSSSWRYSTRQSRVSLLLEDLLTFPYTKQGGVLTANPIIPEGLQHLPAGISLRRGGCVQSTATPGVCVVCRGVNVRGEGSGISASAFPVDGCSGCFSKC